ncbi:MAG: hypothetical protein FJ278_14755, partial [Planctomycetes bacterium]|nr:hypothetical protein [Planctomycetota bacterium]
MGLTLLAVLCGAVWGEKAEVVVVEADGQRGREDAKNFTSNVTRCLDTFRIAYDKTSDSAVERGGLKGYKVAIFPYNPDMSDGQAAAVEQFIAAGGKVVAFYTIPSRVAGLLGIRAMRYQAKAYEGQFSAMRFKPGVVTGAPTEVKQSSWNIQAVTIEPPARVLAEWHDGAGKATGFPAVVVSPNGAFMTHVMLTGDAENRAQFMLAMLGHLLPSIWQKAVSGALGEIGKVSTCKSLDDLAQAVELARKSGQNVASAESRLGSAR